MDRSLIDAMLDSKAWPFLEAQKILKKINYKLPKKGYVLFETGYGPSGLPHIGTLVEQIRTVMVQRAFEAISGMPTKLFCFSDDMDGMRKIPDNIPNKKYYEQYIDLPLSKIPDPFGEFTSYAAYMNNKMCQFLNQYDFEYEFFSATEYYHNGTFNHALNQVLQNYDKIMNIMIPTLGAERQKTYSPFIPICPSSGKVLYVPTLAVDTEKQTISYKHPDSGDIIETKVTDGACKLQWKPDFGMRWYALDVDFEMYGKDHLVNGVIYSKICGAIGGTAPHQMFFELFLDEQGLKISKSKGNGLSIDQWLRYGSQESLVLFFYQSPQKAKKLYFDVIPKAVDEYIKFLNKYQNEELDKRLVNPLYHIHNGQPPQLQCNISYSLLLNLVNACNTDDTNVIWGYLKNYDNNLDTANTIFYKNLVNNAMNYYHDFVKPNKKYRTPNEQEAVALTKVMDNLKSFNAAADAAEIQNMLYTVGKDAGFELRLWFQALYEILLGAAQGPRFGSFIALYGIEITIKLIEEKLLL